MSLNELVAEFETEFPGWRIEDICRSRRDGSRDDEGQRPEGQEGWFRVVFPIEPGCHPWGVCVSKDGWEPRESFCTEWAETPEAGVATILGMFRLRRDSPHVAHVMDGDLLRTCDQCVVDAGELNIPVTDLPVNIR